jgi:hypothetical protein
LHRRNIFNVPIANSGKLADSGVVYSARTYLIIHGFTDSQNNPWAKKIITNLLSMENVNVIAVDWSKGATFIQSNVNDIFSYLPYLTAAKNTLIVGNRTATFLRLNGVNLSNVHCIGHSLGAHCCG